MNIESISSKNLSKELAYLLGVYLTDGSITHYESYQFTLKTIDKDFAENTLNAFKKIYPENKSQIFIQKAINRYWEDGRVSKCQDQYCIGMGFAKFGDFFKSQTNNKHHIPFVIWDASLQIKKWFIAGVLDGDGWISKTERKNYKKVGNSRDIYNGFQYRIGIGKTDESWIHEFKELLQKMGVETLKKEIDMRLPRNKVMIKFGIKINSFVSHGLFFTIRRKQERVELLRSVQRLKAAYPTG
jgi:intein/homing endonuclease